MNQIKKPIIKAIYFDHELIRTHLFFDGKKKKSIIKHSLKVLDL
jgi:hypothetical protein